MPIPLWESIFLNYKQYDKAEIALNKALKINEKTKHIMLMLIMLSIFIMISEFYMNVPEIKKRLIFYLKAYTDAFTEQIHLYWLLSIRIWNLLLQ